MNPSRADELERCLRAVAGGDYGVRVGIGPDRDGCAVAAAFNQMAEALEAARDGLVEQQHELEERVVWHSAEAARAAAAGQTTEAGLRLIADRIPGMMSYMQSDERFAGLDRREGMRSGSRTGCGTGPCNALSRDIAARNRSEEVLLESNAALKKINDQLRDAQHQLLQSEKMASVGQLAAGVAHEINNPLGYVHSNLGTLDQYLASMLDLLTLYQQAECRIDDPAARLALEQARADADLDFMRTDLLALTAESKEGISRVKKIVHDLKNFSHADQTDEWQWSDLHQGIESTLNIAWNELKYKVELHKEYGTLPPVLCLPSQLNQVFMNLLVNGAQAIRERGTISIRSGVNGDMVWLKFTDSGEGIDPANLDRIFDPFFTTKPVGKGTGLGLSLSYGIVQKHRGRIEVASVRGEGTTFTVWLPIGAPTGNGLVATEPAGAAPVAAASPA